MLNRMFFNELEIIDKIKEGRRSNLTLENGNIIGSSSIYNKTIEIECHKCLKLSSVKFYSTLFKREYICQSCVKLGEKNPFYGKEHSVEFKEKLSKERKGKWGVGKDNAMYGVNAWESLDNKTVKRLKAKLSKTHKGCKNAFYGKTHTQETRDRISKASKQYCIDHPEHIQRMTEASLKRQRSGLKTKIEKTVENKLNELEIPNKYSKILHRKCQYDFLVGEDILLEVHGDYWHANPEIYGEGKKPLNATQKYKIKRDKFKKEFAIKYGYKIFYIWETEINKGDFSIIAEIQKELKGDLC